MYTIYQIADHNKHTGGHYFDRDTLRFFGQTLRSFTVYEYKGRTFTFAPSGGNWSSGLWSVAEYNPETGDMDKPNTPRDFDTNGLTNRNDVRAAIRKAIDEQEA